MARLLDLIDELTNWYIRFNRKRLKGGDRGRGYILGSKYSFRDTIHAHEDDGKCPSEDCFIIA